MRSHHRLERLRDERSILDARSVGCEPLVLQEMLETKCSAKPFESRIVTDRKHHVSVGGSKDLIRNDVRVLVAQARRVLACRKKVHGLIRKPCNVRIEHPDVDLLTFAGCIAMTQGSEHPDATVQPGEQISHRNADFLRFSIRSAGHAHYA